VLAKKHEIPIERIAALAQVAIAELRDPGKRFPQVVANRLAELLYQRVGGSAAMEAAQLVEPGHFALVELLARTSPTVREGMGLTCKFFPLLHDDMRLEHEVRPDGAALLRIVSPPRYPVHHGYIELIFAIVMLGIRRETKQQGVAPLEVWFKHRAPVDRSAFEPVLGPGVRFDMPENRWLLGRQVASLRLARENSIVHRDAIRAAADLMRG
jgi:hypothetical protein